MKTVLLLLAVVLVVGCEVESSAGPVPACDHVIAGAEPLSGPTDGGTEVTVTGTFIATTSSRDVQVRVGGYPATVVSMDRQGCDTCDACANEALICASCDRECRGLAEFTDGGGTVWEASECVETLVFETPAGEAGPATVLIVNSRGSSDDITFLYESSGDDDDSAGDDDDSAGDDDDSVGDDDDSAGDDDDSVGDDDDSAGDDDDSAGDDDDSAGDDDDSAGDDDDSAR